MFDKDLLSGLIRLHILHHASREPVFGLGIIEELGRHGYRLSAGTLYPLLHGLEKKGYLLSAEERAGRRARRIYRATPEGVTALETAMEKVRELFGEFLREAAGTGPREPAGDDGGEPPRATAGEVPDVPAVESLGQPVDRSVDVPPRGGPRGGAVGSELANDEDDDDEGELEHQREEETEETT